MTKYGIRKVANHWQAFIHTLAADATSPTEVWACGHEHSKWEEAVLCGGGQLAEMKTRALA